MPTTLHIQRPGEAYIDGGTEAEVELSCIDINNHNHKVLAKIETITVRVDSFDPFVFEQVFSREPGLDYVVLTRITSRCADATVTLAMERAIDIQKAAECCLDTVPAFPPTPPASNLRAWDFGAIETDPYDDLLVGTDDVDYTQNGESEPGAFAVQVDTTGFEEDFFFVLRELAAQPDRNHYFNGPNVYGTIPDLIWRESFVVGLYKYTITRVAATFDQNYLTNFTS